MRFVALGLAALVVAAGPARAQTAQDSAYTRVYAMADSAGKKNLLTPAQARELKATLQRQIAAFNSAAGDQYLFPSDLSALDTPYDLLGVSRLDGRFQAADHYANAAGPGMSGKLGSQSRYQAYWESLSMDNGRLSAHVYALVRAYELAASPWDRTRADLLADLDSDDGPTRSRAGQELVGDSALMAQRLASSDADVRFKTAWTLWDITIPHFSAFRLVPLAAPLLSDPSAKVRPEVIGFLAAMKNFSYQDQVAKLLTDQNVGVRENAAIYLGWAKATQYRAQITAMLKDPEEGVRKAAQGALDDMDGK